MESIIGVAVTVAVNDHQPFLVKYWLRSRDVNIRCPQGNACRVGETLPGVWSTRSCLPTHRVSPSSVRCTVMLYLEMQVGSATSTSITSKGNNLPLKNFVIFAHVNSR